MMALCWGEVDKREGGSLEKKRRMAGSLVGTASSQSDVKRNLQAERYTSRGGLSRANSWLVMRLPPHNFTSGTIGFHSAAAAFSSAIIIHGFSLQIPPFFSNTIAPPINKYESADGLGGSTAAPAGCRGES